MQRRTTAARRAGFSLIELLLVMAIMGVLIGLLVGAVMRVQATAKRVRTVTEIDQLSTSCTMFKKDFGIYPPSTFTVPANVPDPTMPNAAADSSYRVLQKMFPRWNTGAAAGSAITYPSGFGLTAGTVLDGNECLVFFLGGPDKTNPGWHPAQPGSPTGNAKRGPYFEFSPSRFPTGLAKTWYVDPYGSPYAYFASKASGGYDTTLQFPLASPNGPMGGWKSASDTNVNGTTVAPFFISTNRAVNHDSVQIISPGQDTRFGPGGTWSPGNGSYLPNTDGGDDLANFNNGTALGSNP